MYSALSPGAIGVRVASLEEAIAAARKAGFAGVEFSPGEVADRVETQGVDAIRRIFEEAGIRPAGFGLPVDWRGDEAAWQRDLALLPRLAQAAAAIGGGRTMTWIMPCSNTLPFPENRAFHVKRFQPIAQVLAEHGCRLGLEFIGTKTLRDSQQYPFIYRMEEMLAMAADIGPNVGILLDTWHWYTSGGTLEDLRALRPEQVVYVHVNDAPADVPVEAQIDNVRALPGETGVIDIAGFLQALRDIGYNGPVTPEPFSEKLRALPSDDDRLRLIGESMRRIGL